MLSRKDYEEKRDHNRMAVECTARYRVEGGQEEREGRGRDLSASGVLLIADQELAVGTRLTVELSPDQPLVPPLRARAEVVRSEPEAGERFAMGLYFTEVER